MICTMSNGLASENVRSGLDDIMIEAVPIRRLLLCGIIGVSSSIFV